MFYMKQKKHIIYYLLKSYLEYYNTPYYCEIEMEVSQTGKKKTKKKPVSMTFISFISLGTVMHFAK